MESGQYTSEGALMRRDSGSIEKILEEVRRLSAEQRKELLQRIEHELADSVGSEPDRALSAEQQRQLWQAWVDAGPKGPIEDEGEPEFP